MGTGQSAVSLITSRLRRSEGCGADWTAHDRGTWWVLIAWLLLWCTWSTATSRRPLPIVNARHSPTLLPISRELVQPAAEAHAWADAALAAEATPSA